MGGHGRHILNGLEMNIKLIHSPESFHHMANDTAFTIFIEDVALVVRKVKHNPSIPNQQTKSLPMAGLTC